MYCRWSPKRTVPVASEEGTGLDKSNPGRSGTSNQAGVLNDITNRLESADPTDWDLVEAAILERQRLLDTSPHTRREGT
jgi:hypothetical protein